MKANEVPEKIYCTSTEGGFYLTTIKPEPPFAEGVEYIKTDAFIEKACDAYCKVCGHYPHTTPDYICRQACDYYKDFRACIKGE